MAKSYSSVLIQTSSASPDEIMSVYRRLAKEFHQDRHTGGDEPIQDVYSVRPAVKRPPVSGSSPGPEPLIPKQQPVDMGEISPFGSFQTFTPSLEEIFEWIWSNFSSFDPPKSGRLQALTLEIALTLEEAMRGGNARIMVPARAFCPICHGYGEVGFNECPRCAGEGAVSGEVPISISFPAGLMGDHALVIPLERFGIRNLRLTVLFRLTDE
jgi:molecular chaperone DnaJ